MKKESSSFGLTPHKLAKLLEIGSDIPETGNEVDQEQKKAQYPAVRSSPSGPAVHH